MVPDILPVSLFFEGAKPQTAPVLFLVPIVLAVIFLRLIDLVGGATTLFRRRAGRR